MPDASTRVRAETRVRRVLMISPHFPPDSSAGTHRARLLAPRLAEYGWEPTVLTVDASAYEGPLDLSLADSVPRTLRVVRSRAWRADTMRPFGLGDLGLRAFAALRRDAVALLAAERFDAVYMTTYPIYPAALGPMLKRRFGVPFVIDFQDPWVGAWGQSVGGGPGGSADFKSRASRAVAAWLEPRVLRAADGITAVSAATYEDALHRTRLAAPAATAELPIGWDERDIEYLETHASPAPRRLPVGDGLVHLAYVGTLLPTGIDTLRAICRAWSQWRTHDRAAAERLRVHLVGTSNQRSGGTPRALPIAEAFGLGDLVTEHPARVDYFDALRVLRDATAILLMGSREPHYTPSKLYPAMMSERPLVAVYHAASTAASMLRRLAPPPSVRLVTFDDELPVASKTDDIAAQLCDLVRCPAFDARAVDRRVLSGTSASTLAGRLAAVLDEAAR